MVPASSGGAVQPGGAAPLAPIAQPTPIQVDGNKKNYATGSVGMTLDMITDKIAFGGLFAIGGAHSALAHGGALGTYGAYHPVVVSAMRCNGWALISGKAATPSRDDELEEWADELVRGVAAQLIASDEVTSVMASL